jgi:PleD family two-component response regulator
MIKVLIIDDQISMLEALRLALESEYRVQVTQSGEDGFRPMQEWRPEILLVDFNMPGINGLELIRKVREAGNHSLRPTIILFSG